jgi:hypothetical protein
MKKSNHASLLHIPLFEYLHDENVKMFKNLDVVSEPRTC